MKKQAIIHLMTKKRLNSSELKIDIDAMEELYEKYGIENVIFYKGEKLEYMGMIEKLEKFGITTQNYSNRDELIEKVKFISETTEVLFVYTALEILIKMANRVMKELGFILSDDTNIFRNKFLQRSLLQKNRPELGVKFITGTPDTFQIEQIEKKLGYPFIIKPIDGIQSAGVEKIENRNDFQNYIKNYDYLHEKLKNRGVDNKELIAEEFIDGKLYTLDYFVDKNGFVTTSKPAREMLGVEIKIDDYCVIARMCSQEVEMDLKGRKLKTFVSNTVTACGIRNSFVHHEFKLTSKGQLKTIELNGRLGGGRLDLLKKSYKVNLFEMLLNPNFRVGRLKNNNIVVNLYAISRGKLEAYNNKILARIKTLPSVYDIKLNGNFLGKEIGPTKDGFTKVGQIFLQHKDYTQIQRDYTYIISKYKHMLYVEADNLLNKLMKYI